MSRAGPQIRLHRSSCVAKDNHLSSTSKVKSGEVSIGFAVKCHG